MIFMSAEQRRLETRTLEYDIIWLHNVPNLLASLFGCKAMPRILFPSRGPMVLECAWAVLASFLVSWLCKPFGSRVERAARNWHYMWPCFARARKDLPMPLGNKFIGNIVWCCLVWFLQPCGWFFFMLPHCNNEIFFGHAAFLNHESTMHLVYCCPASCSFPNAGAFDFSLFWCCQVSCTNGHGWSRWGGGGWRGRLRCRVWGNDSDDWKEFSFCVSKRTAQQLIQSANLVMMSISLKASAFRARGQDQQKLTFRTRSGLVVMGEKEI